MGFKSHSEIGWVLREYNDLVTRAQKMGLRSPDSYYAQGKVKGKINRDKGVDAPKAAQKTDIFVKKGDVSDINSEYYSDMEENETSTLLNKPSLNEFPKLVKKGKTTEIPELLEGSGSSKRK